MVVELSLRALCASAVAALSALLEASRYKIGVPAEVEWLGARRIGPDRKSRVALRALALRLRLRVIRSV